MNVAHNVNPSLVGGIEKLPQVRVPAHCRAAHHDTVHADTLELGHVLNAKICQHADGERAFAIHEHHAVLVEPDATDAPDDDGLADIEHVDFYRSSTVPLEVWMLAMSADEESYRSNAESRAQYAGYLTMRASLQRDPEWHDVSQILSFASET